jgi:glyoxylase-like metal-dependent hydrolase (beta-lactamase superfamily II)
MPLTLRAFNASEWTGPTGNNTYLLTGQVPALVDAGVGHDDHLSAVRAALSGNDLALILITHGHSDHVGGIPALRARWPEVRLLGAADLREGDEIAAGDTHLRALPTPGHSPDHLCFVDESEGDIYSGDLVRRGGTIVIPASKGGNLRQYLASLRRVRDLAPRRLLPGHGPIIDEPTVIIDEYLRHRAEREAQVIAALRPGPRTPAAVAADIYGRLPAVFAAAAIDGVLAHLRKLEEDGVAGPRPDRDAGEWELR